MSSEKKQQKVVDEIATLLLEIFQRPSAPALPKKYADVESLQTLYTNLLALRDSLYAASTGNLEENIIHKGYLWGTLKALQGNLRHLTWQTKMVAEGDFTQRVEFMGEFANSFNAMVMQLDQNLKALKDKEEQLNQINEDLTKEVAVRRHTEKVLLEREETLRLLATTDPLTNLFNRRHFSDLAETEIRRMLRYKRPLAAIMFDIDHFKQINDTYGHVIGDMVIKMIADATKALIRRPDIAARYGGEEFIILLPETSAWDAINIAERLRQQIEQTTVETEAGSIHVTASFGINDYLDKNDYGSIEVLLAKFISYADQALYSSKSSGRNRVTVYKS